MPDGGRAISVNDLVDRSPAELIDHVCFGESGPIYEAPPPLFTCQHSPLAKASHHGHDRGVPDGASLVGSKGRVYLPDGCLAPGKDLADDRSCKRPEHIIEGGRLRPRHAWRASFARSIAAGLSGPGPSGDQMTVPRSGAVTTCL